MPFDKHISISTKTGDNVDNLKEMLLDYVTSKNTGVSSLVLTNTRHIEALKQALENTQKSIDSTSNEMISLDLISIDIKSIWLSLGNITGNSDNERIIDDIFSKFCVGK